ncbi:MAG: hypothetical protein ACYYK0_01630 [Candidatus Eutrophobiaceae bacterium]
MNIRRFILSFVLPFLVWLPCASMADDSLDLNEIRRAAEQGHADAQYNLGMMYAKGSGHAAG